MSYLHLQSFVRFGNNQLQHQFRHLFLKSLGQGFEQLQHFAFIMQVVRIERAENNTNMVTLNRVADALEVPLHTLFLFEG